MAANDLAQLLAPQFEAWLSFQSVTSEGLVSRRNDVRRNHVITVHGAPARLEEALLDEWADCTPEQAHTTLSKPDVVVTNMKDKEVQLRKLEQLNEEVRGAFNAAEAQKLRAEGKSPMRLLEWGFSYELLEEAGCTAQFRPS